MTKGFVEQPRLHRVYALCNEYYTVNVAGTATLEIHKCCSAGWKSDKWCRHCAADTCSIFYITMQIEQLCCGFVAAKSMCCVLLSKNWNVQLIFFYLTIMMLFTTNNNRANYERIKSNPAKFYFYVFWSVAFLYR